jgi:serine/threonine protein kinase
MECMQVSMQRHMQWGNASSDSVKLSIARHVTSGLEHLHARNLQHEDLCPSNVLLAWKHGEMQVKLCDFYNEQTGCNRTAAYDAPEVVLLHAADVTSTADMWTLACCLLFMEGAEPFTGFESAPCILLYLAHHLCVAFQECSTITQFTLHDWAYGPVRHIAHSMWADILRHVFVSQAARLTAQQLQAKLDALHDATRKQPSWAALRRINFEWAFWVASIRRD